MPERTKNDDFAEKAYAAAAAEMKSAGRPADAKSNKPAPGSQPTPPVSVKAAEPPKAPAAPANVKKLPEAKKAVPVKPASAAKKSVAPEKAPTLPPVKTKAPAAPKAPAPTQGKAPIQPAAPVSPVVPAPVAEAPAIVTPLPTSTDLKETIMASAPKNDNVQQINDTVNNTMTSAMSELQTRAKAAYEKGTETAGEVTEFAKGNVEAVVESTKIFAAGVQDLGRSYVEEARTAYETMSADVKEMAAIKSPTELFQLQGRIVRRNLDAMIATSSKNTEALMKLASEAFAPLTGRVNVAAEKLTKVA